jgi:hypothetical protein
MGVLVEALIAAFDSSAELVWTTAETSQAVARFEVSGTQVDWKDFGR